MRHQLLVASFLLGITVTGFSAETDPVTMVERVCGKLAVGKEKPRSDDATFLRNSTVRLYTRTPGTDCCATLSPVGEAVTGRLGNFHFKKIRPGDYWLVAEIDAVKYKLPIRYQPDKQTESDCSSYWYVLRAGQLRFENYVTVTVTQK